MKSCEKPLKTVKQMQSIIHHMRWYEMYEKLWKYMKSNQNRRRTAGVPRTPPPTDRCQAMRNNEKLWEQIESVRDMKWYEKLWKATRSFWKIQSVRHHMRWYEIYEKLWKHKMKNTQNRRRTAGVPQTHPTTDRCQAMRNNEKRLKQIESVIWDGMECMKSYENIWKAIKTAGVPQAPPPTDRCQAMRNNEKLWKQIESVRDTWHGMQNYENLWKSMEGNSWQSMDINGICHNSLEVHGCPRNRVDIS